MVHATKGIVLRSIHYGETSLIVSVYTELFGVQSYIVKGVRQAQKRGSYKAAFFQPGAILDMEVYHNELKNLQFVRNYSWAVVYQQVFSNIVRNSVALYLVELLSHSLKQPEANPELFYLLEDSLKQADRGSDTLVANLPLYFTLHLGTELGFQLQGQYSATTPVLDLLEGSYVPLMPNHPHYLVGREAQVTSELSNLPYYEALANVMLNREERRRLLASYQQYIAVHVQDFAPLKSVDVLQEVLG